MRRSALIGACAVAACTSIESYDAPPQVNTLSLDKGVYDPLAGPLLVELSEPVDVATLKVRIVASVYSEEHELCLDAGDGLPTGCSEPAEVVVESDDDAITVEGRQTITIDAAEQMKRFSPYVLRIDAGLRDDAGRATGVPIEIPFVVGCALTPGPTDFESGMFLGLLVVIEPIPTRVNLFLYLAVDPATGALRVFGADADPTDPAVVERTSTDRQPLSWKADALPPEGFTVRAEGLVTSCDGSDVMLFEPFDLEVFTPPVLVRNAEFLAEIHTGPIANGPDGDRQQVDGQLVAERVLIGISDPPLEVEGGSGPLSMFRLTDEESPALEELLGDDLEVEDVLSAFD